MKLLIVFGTRPEAIKMAPLIKEFRKHNDIFEIKVCVTAQHRQMLDQVLNLFEIKPDYDLNIMKAGQDLYDITTNVLHGIKNVLSIENPDLVLVHGDTTTSTAAALASFYNYTPVGHVEAGLRTYNIYSPWPEEMNRQITGRIATYHFAPTDLSKNNLLKENINDRNICVTGNTGIDALHWVLTKLNESPEIELSMTSKLIDNGIPLEKIKSWKCTKDKNHDSEINENVVKPRKMVLITGHRRENFGQGFINICEAIKELANKYPNADFVYPMHLNPNVRDAIRKVFGKIEMSNVLDQKKCNRYFIEPLDYLPFVYMMNLSYFVMTDSGGIQEEAPGLGKPVLVMRDTTERPEALDAGTVKLVGTDKSLIIHEAELLFNNIGYYNKMSKSVNPYGDGTACRRIVNYLSEIVKNN